MGDCVSSSSMVQGGVFLPRHLPTPSQNARHSSRLIIVGAVALTIAALVLVASSSAPSSLLELAGRPVEFVEAPTGAQYTAIPVGYQQPGVAYQQYQQPALAYSPYQQAPLRTQYVTYAAPSTGYPVASAPVQQVVQQPAALSPLQSEQQLSAGAKQAMNAAPSAKTIKAGKADEVSLLRKELHKASAQVDHYERHVRYLLNAAAVEERRAKAALHEVDKAKNAAAFANAERAAAKRLEDIAATAKDHLIRKKAVADSLRPVVQRKVTLSRAMASRAQRETAAIASTQEAEQRDRYLLRKQLHLAADATRRAHIASSSIAAMKKRAAALRQEATADDAEADKDIKTARASVEGARKSAAATLRAIQASLHGGKAKSTKQKANASKLANSARTATRLMSTDKAKAKTLRSEAADERRRARQLSQQIAQREEEVPSDQQAALLAKNQATRLRASLERHVINGLPFNNDVQTSEQLAQTASLSAAAAVNSLAVSSAQQQRATRIFQKAKVFADREDDKALTDAKTATTRLQQATKLFKVHDARRRLYIRKMAKLKGVLASSREELAALQNEATDIA